MKHLIFTLSFLFLSSTFATELPVVIIETNMGTLEAQLEIEKAPVSVKNFLDYVDAGFYNQTIIHRVVKDFVIQGGGFDLNFNEKETREPIINEAINGLSNLKGTLGMARNSDINSATSQFYINTKDNVRLNYQSPEKYGYAVFGRVIKGIEVVEKIEVVAVHSEKHGEEEFENVPIEPVIILGIRRK